VKKEKIYEGSWKNNKKIGKGKMIIKNEIYIQYYDENNNLLYSNDENNFEELIIRVNQLNSSNEKKNK